MRWRVRSVCPVVALAFAVGLSLVAVGPANASSGDWVTYGATNGRSGFDSAETAITPSTASQLHVAWMATAQNIVFSQPVVANGLVYWGSLDGYERATNASGSLVWQTYLGQTTSCSFTAGVASTATVVNGVVYVGSGDGQLYALDAATGAVRWQTRLGASPSTFLWGSPAVFGGSVYMGVSSFLDCPLVQGQLVRLDATTGAVENTMKVVPDGCTGGSVWSSPAVDEAASTVYFATGNPGSCNTTEPYAEAVIEVRASDLSVVGSWQIPKAQSTPDGDFGSAPTLFTRPNKNSQAMVGIANKNGWYYAFQRDSLPAGPKWRLQVAISGDCPECGQGSIAPSAWDGHTLYVAGGNVTISGVNCAGSVAALNPATGGILWRRCLPNGPVLGALATAPGILAVAEGNQLLVVSATSGQTLFAYATRGQIWGAPSIANGILYQGDNSGTLYALSVAGPVTSVLVPSNGAALKGSQILDASTSDNVNVTKVEFHLTGGALNNALIATASLTSYGWIASWDTTTVADGTYTLYSVADDAAGKSGYSTGITVTVDNIPPTTSVVVPSNGAALTGTQTLDATASDAGGVTKVEFHLTGGTLNNALIATASLTYYGWVASWDTTTVANGTYTLQSLAYDAGGNSTYSTGITVSLDNSAATSVLVPSNGTSLTGTQTLDASASEPGGVTKVEFHLTGGTLNNALIATASLTYYGWVASWDTTTVANGPYTLQSVAYDTAGNSTYSTGVTVSVNNAPSVTSVDPNTGSTAGGTAVTITGTNFTGATGVTFGATLATSFVVNSATSITATSPAEATGTVDVTVTTAGGTSATSSADQFSYM